MENILDASAILSLILRETGHEAVTQALSAGSAASTVNLAEVTSRCARVGMPADVIRQLVGLLPVAWIDADQDLAFRVGELAAPLRPFGLSLGDRCCLALAMRERVPAVTADRAWAGVAPLLGVEVRLIR